LPNDSEAALVTRQTTLHEDSLTRARNRGDLLPTSTVPPLCYQ
jgi:hypothetical protein